MWLGSGRTAASSVGRLMDGWGRYGCGVRVCVSRHGKPHVELPVVVQSGSEWKELQKRAAAKLRVSAKKLAKGGVKVINSSTVHLLPVLPNGTLHNLVCPHARYCCSKALPASQLTKTHMTPWCRWMDVL